MPANVASRTIESRRRASESKRRCSIVATSYAGRSGSSARISRDDRCRQTRRIDVLRRPHDDEPAPDGVLLHGEIRRDRRLGVDFVLFRVGDDADDRAPRTVRALPQPLADRAFVRPESRGELVVDDHHLRRLPVVRLVEEAALEQRDAHRAEIVGADVRAAGDDQIIARRLRDVALDADRLPRQRDGAERKLIVGPDVLARPATRSRVARAADRTVKSLSGVLYRNPGSDTRSDSTLCGSNPGLAFVMRA